MGQSSTCSSPRLDGDDTGEAWITTSGFLVTRRYEAEFPHGHFCTEFSEAGDLLSVMCDPCKGEVRAGVWKY